MAITVVICFVTWVAYNWRASSGLLKKLLDPTGISWITFGHPGFNHVITMDLPGELSHMERSSLLLMGKSTVD